MLEYQIVPIERWPEGWDRRKLPTRYSPFSGNWSSTMQILERELNFLHARQIVLQVDAATSQIRRDGMLKEDARVGYPGVILGFDTSEFGGLSYPCNAFITNRKSAWQENVRAIALGLEALRKVERYGIANRGQQYAGFRELGSGLAVSSMSEERAWDILMEAAERFDLEEPDELFRLAAMKHHPDVGGDDDFFKLLVEARDKLKS